MIKKWIAEIKQKVKALQRHGQNIKRGARRETLVELIGPIIYLHSSGFSVLYLLMQLHFFFTDTNKFVKS